MNTTFTTNPLSVSESSQSQCLKETKVCETFNKSLVTCFGSTLPYDSTSFDLVTDASNFEQAKEKLLLWSGKFSRINLIFLCLKWHKHIYVIYFQFA